MKELERISQNNKGEIPEGKKTTVTVLDIKDPNAVLGICKKVVSAFLENQHLKTLSPTWENVFPKKIIDFIKQLDDEDYANDDLICSLEIIVYNLKEIREWEWYSSKVEETGFNIVFTGEFTPQFAWIIHNQGIPYSKIRINEDGYGDYSIKAFKDITTYKKF